MSTKAVGDGYFTSSLPISTLRWRKAALLLAFSTVLVGLPKDSFKRVLSTSQPIPKQKKESSAATKTGLRAEFQPQYSTTTLNDRADRGPADFSKTPEVISGSKLDKPDTETLVGGSNEKSLIDSEPPELIVAADAKNSSVGEAAEPFIASELNEFGSAYDKSDPETLIGTNNAEHTSSTGAIDLIVGSDSDKREKDLILNPTGFYTWAQEDRSGSVIQDMMFQHARLFSYNLTYLGACIPAVSDAHLHRSTHEALIRAIGLEDVLKFSCPDDLDEMERQPPGAEMNMYDAWTPEWIDYIRSKTKYPKTTKAENQTVIHIRRGDVDPCLKIQGKLGNRYLPNSYFKAVIEKYIPEDSPITAYSEKQSFEPWKDWRDFSRPVHFQLDTDLTEAWQTMMTADFLVLSKSTFSIVPAILNRNGRILFHPHSYFAALPGFIHVSDDIVEEADREIILMQKRLSCFEPDGWRRK